MRIRWFLAVLALTPSNLAFADPLLITQVERIDTDSGDGVAIAFSLLISDGSSSCPCDAIASIFVGPTLQLFDESDVGQTFSVSSSDSGFSEFVAALADGNDDNLIVTRTLSTPPVRSPPRDGASGRSHETLICFNGP